MANAQYNPWAGLPQIGANIGRGIQQRGQQEQQWLAELLRRKEERRYQESLPTFKASEEKFQQMIDIATAAKKFAESQEVLYPAFQKIIEDQKITSPEWQGITGQIPSGAGYGETLSWLQGLRSDWAEGQIATEKRGLARRKTEAEIKKLGQPPSPPKPTPIAQQRGLDKDLEAWLWGKKPKVSAKREQHPETKKWGYWSIPGTAEQGFLERVLGFPKEVIREAIESPEGLMGSYPGIGDLLKTQWEKEKATKSPVFRERMEQWLGQFSSASAGGNDFEEAVNWLMQNKNATRVQAEQYLRGQGGKQ